MEMRSAISGGSGLRLANMLRGEMEKGAGAVSGPNQERELVREAGAGKPSK